jgi:hypothetical protein
MIFGVIRAIRLNRDSLDALDYRDVYELFGNSEQL